MPLSVPMFAGMTLSDPEKRKLLRRRELVDRGVKVLFTFSRRHELI
jgi:hypothetical protein